MCMNGASFIQYYNNAAHIDARTYSPMLANRGMECDGVKLGLYKDQCMPCSRHLVESCQRRDEVVPF